MAEIRMLTKTAYLVATFKDSPYDHLCSIGLRMTAKKPTLGPDERAIKLDVKLPITLFKEPQLLATIEIPAEEVSSPELRADVLDNVEEALEGLQGVRMDVRLVTPCDD